MAGPNLYTLCPLRKAAFLGADSQCCAKRWLKQTLKPTRARLPWPASERYQTPVLHLTSEQPTACVRCAAHVLLLARALDRGSAELPGPALWTARVR